MCGGLGAVFCLGFGASPQLLRSRIRRLLAGTHTPALCLYTWPSRGIFFIRILRQRWMTENKGATKR
jgi:hypothetical protein